MKKLISILILSTLIIPFSSFNSYATDKVIYGDDNRLDYNNMSSSMKKLADSVVSLWGASALMPEGNSYKLDTINFGDTYNLCPEERFREQKFGAFCSGSLVGDDIIMTAGHCIEDENDCANTKFVFGFGTKAKFITSLVGDEDSETSTPNKISKNDVYSCKHIIKRFLGSEAEFNEFDEDGEWTEEDDEFEAAYVNKDLGADYALIKLDRQVKGRAPLAINRGKSAAKGTKLFVIGHPMGLPVKLAKDASVRKSDEKKEFFVANLDTYGGNSGSPVFNDKTNLIEGILVRGDTDFVDSAKGCSISNVLSQSGGRGEDVTKISVLSSFIPKLSKKTPNAEESIATDMSVENLLDTGMNELNIPMPAFE
ncbi:MAG: serine protease [Elusimicrobiota bacterium]|nr:serine protease [Elusimicrobiota bacterium]